jgi:hypothetical protein
VLEKYFLYCFSYFPKSLDQAHNYQGIQGLSFKSSKDSHLPRGGWRVWIRKSAGALLQIGRAEGVRINLGRPIKYRRPGLDLGFIKPVRNPIPRIQKQRPRFKTPKTRSHPINPSRTVEIQNALSLSHDLISAGPNQINGRSPSCPHAIPSSAAAAAAPPNTAWHADEEKHQPPRCPNPYGSKRIMGRRSWQIRTNHPYLNWRGTILRTRCTMAHHGNLFSGEKFTEHQELPSPANTADRFPEGRQMAQTRSRFRNTVTTTNPRWRSNPNAFGSARRAFLEMMLRVDRVGALYRAKATKIGGMVATVSKFGGRSGHGARAAKAARFVPPPDSVAREELIAGGVPPTVRRKREHTTKGWIVGIRCQWPRGVMRGRGGLRAWEWKWVGWSSFGPRAKMRDFYFLHSNLFSLFKFKFKHEFQILF